MVLFSNNEKPDKLPLTSRIGISFVEPKKFSIATDFQIHNLFGLGLNRVTQLSVGGEYNIENIIEFIPFYLRFGINHSIYHTYFTPGFGLSVYTKDFITQIDFAYKVRNDYPKDEFAISFTIRK